MSIREQLIYLLILLGLSGFFSGSEVALLSISKFKVRHLFDKNKPGAIALKKLKDSPHRMLTTILIGNNLVNVASSAMATSIAIGYFSNYGIGIATGIMTFLILVFGEITPKSIATEHNEKIALIVAGPIWFLSILLKPIISIFDVFTKAFIKLFGSKTKKPSVTEEEVKSMVEFGEEEGTIKEVEKKMIHKIFEFDKVNASEVMTPKIDMAAITRKANVKDLVDFYLKHHYSRIPVYRISRDHIIGIVFVKDTLRLAKEKKWNVSVEKMMRKPYFVPGVKKIDNLLRQFQKRKEHMAIVVNEHGSVIGLITLEDVVEEIVGEIVDETDKIDPNIRKLNPKTWIVKGKTDIDEVNEKLKTDIKGKGFDTLNGFILHRKGSIPKKGEEVSFGKFIFKIEGMEGHRISDVRVFKK